MTDRVKEFIERHIDKIENNEFFDLFETASTALPLYEDVGDFTTCMLEANIDPLPHLPYIPTAYLYGQNVSYFGIPTHVDNIGNFAFQESDLEAIVIPGNVKVIGIKAFCTCESLASVTIEEGCTIIGDYAFMYCDELKEIFIPESVTTIMHDVFYNCDKLTVFCKKGSEAERYAVEYDINYKYY